MRSGGTKCKLCSLRLISILLTILILSIDVGIIAGGYILTGYLQSIYKDPNSFSIVNILISLIPGLVISLMNGIVPGIMEKLVSMEKWDFNSTIITQLIWRNFIAKLFTLTVSYFLVFYFILLDKKQSDLIPGLNVDFKLNLECSSNQTNKTGLNLTEPYTLISQTNYFNCAEDSAVMTLFINVS